MTKQQIKAGVASLLVGVLAPTALLVPSVSAATVNWSGFGEASDSTTMNAANWFDAVPMNGDTAVFGTSGNYQEVDNDITSLSLVDLVFSGAWSGTSSKSYTITGNGITITSGIDAMMTGNGGDHTVGVDVTLGADATFSTSGSNTLQVGDTGKTLNLGTNDLTLNANGGTITLAGSIDGSGKLILSGTKTVNMLAKGATGYTGSVEVTSGVFETSAETEGNVVVNGGTLKGNSLLLDAVSMSSGSIAPGMSPGCLGVDTLTLTGGTYSVEINGNTICTEYDAVQVVTSVNLGTNTTLDISRLSSFAPEVNNTFSIIQLDGSAKVEGSFKDLADGTEFTVDGYTYQINYNAGEGANDVLLLVKATPTAPDTGIGSVLSNPLLALAATIAALSVIGGLKFADSRRK